MNKVDALIDELLLENSEALFGIDNPPVYQCPQIDRMIKDIGYAEKALNKALSYDDADDIREHVDEAVREIWNTAYELEELRETIITLRDWGQRWKDECKRAVNEMNNVKEYLDIVQE